MFRVKISYFHSLYKNKYLPNQECIRDNDEYTLSKYCKVKKFYTDKYYFQDRDELEIFVKDMIRAEPEFIRLIIETLGPFYKEQKGYWRWTKKGHYNLNEVSMTTVWEREVVYLSAEQHSKRIINAHIEQTDIECGYCETVHETCSAYINPKYIEYFKERENNLPEEYYNPAETFTFERNKWISGYEKYIADIKAGVEVGIC